MDDWVKRGWQGGEQIETIQGFSSDSVYTFQSDVQILTSKKVRRNQKPASSRNPDINSKMKRYIEVINNVLQKNIKTASFLPHKTNMAGEIATILKHLFNA